MNAAGGDYLLPVDKPEGPTSHDVVASARRALGTRKIGHTGTLDPFASGLLVLCVGRATRLAEYLSGLDKSYVAVASLGVTTDTLDREGTAVTENEAWTDVTEADVVRALATLGGTVDQVPPQFSAKKVAGEAMHRRARRGERVELAPVRVTIHDLELAVFRPPLVHFTVHCASGTYVRAIARDLGEALGVGAHLTALRRTSVGRFEVDHALPLEALADPEAVHSARIEPLDALDHLPSVELEGDAVPRLLDGQRIAVGETTPVRSGRAPGAASAPLLVSVARERELLAIAELHAGVLKPRKVFAT